jgi:hypothetical protein
MPFGRSYSLSASSLLLLYWFGKLCHAAVEPEKLDRVLKRSGADPDWARSNLADLK